MSDELTRIYNELWEDDWDNARRQHGETANQTHLDRTVTQRRADALIEMAKRANSHRPGCAEPKPLITVLVGAGELTGPIRETFNGTILSTRDVADLLTEADFERAIFGPKGQPVNITSPQRFFTGAMRRAIQDRDRQCQHPSCNVSAEHCQVDHIIEARNGGPTNLDNARLLCPKHNRQRPGRRPDIGRNDDNDDPDQTAP